MFVWNLKQFVSINAKKNICFRLFCFGYKDPEPSFWQICARRSRFFWRVGFDPVVYQSFSWVGSYFSCSCCIVDSFLLFWTFKILRKVENSSILVSSHFSIVFNKVMFLFWNVLHNKHCKCFGSKSKSVSRIRRFLKNGPDLLFIGQNFLLKKLL